MSAAAVAERTVTMQLPPEDVAALAAGAVIVMPGDLFGPGEAAKYLGVNRTTVSRWCREPRYMPPAFQKLGGADVWTRAALDAFKARHRETADAAGRRPLGTAASTPESE